MSKIVDKSLGCAAQGICPYYQIERNRQVENHALQVFNRLSAHCKLELAPSLEHPHGRTCAAEDLALEFVGQHAAEREGVAQVHGNLVVALGRLGIHPFAYL